MESNLEQWKMNKFNHLNFCRQLSLQCESMIKSQKLSNQERKMFSRAIDLHKASAKFILPKGGRLFDDYQFKALDENELLHLPYQCIALEYEACGGARGANEPVGYSWSMDNISPIYEDETYVEAPKRICFAREDGEWIVLTIAAYTRHDGQWHILPECAIPRTGYLDRSVKSPDGRVAILAKFADERIDIRGDYMDEIGALLCFLNALQCSNVAAVKSEPKKKNAKLKSALAFDSYYVLTINQPISHMFSCGSSGDRMAPREHLRRGHIRRLTAGRKIWVNAALVNAGKNLNKVHKDYRMVA